MKHYKLLIVDDEQRYANMLANRLKLRGCVCDVCYTGGAAIDIVGKKPFGLVILDLQLPDMYGTEVLKRIKAMRADAAVIVLTGHGTEDDRRECMRLGAHDFIHKPANIDSLMNILKQVKETPA